MFFFSHQGAQICLILHFRGVCMHMFVYCTSVNSKCLKQYRATPNVSTWKCIRVILIFFVFYISIFKTTTYIYKNTEMQGKTQCFAKWNVLRKLVTMKPIMITHKSAEFIHHNYSQSSPVTSLFSSTSMKCIHSTRKQ